MGNTVTICFANNKGGSGMYCIFSVMDFSHRKKYDF